MGGLNYTEMQVRDITIVGAGPAGLAAGIAAKRIGLNYSIIEKGVLVNSIYKFPVNMVFFTTPELLEIGGLPLVSPFEKPTRIEALRYYRRVVDTYELPIDFGEQVVDVKRAGVGRRCSTSRPARRKACGASATAATSSSRSDTSITRTSSACPAKTCRTSRTTTPNRTASTASTSSLSAAATRRPRPRSSCSDRARHVTLVHRHPQLKPSIKYWVRPDIENRIKEGSVRGLFNTSVVEIQPTQVIVERDGSREEIPADAVFLLTGYHPDCDLYRRAGIRLHRETMSPEFNPETFETNVPGIFLAGGAICGRDTSNIFIENGRFHGEKIVSVIAERADRRGKHAHA